MQLAAPCFAMHDSRAPRAPATTRAAIYGTLPVNIFSFSPATAKDIISAKSRQNRIIELHFANSSLQSDAWALLLMRASSRMLIECGNCSFSRIFDIWRHLLFHCLSLLGHDSTFHASIYGRVPLPTFILIPRRSWRQFSHVLTG